MDEDSNPVYAVFAGVIDQNAVSKIFNGVTAAMASNHTRIHMIFHSGGGTVPDGIGLFNFFRSAPIPITLYNVGSCASIAAVSYLGAQERKTSAHATFMLHRTQGTIQAAGAARLHSATNSVILDDIRTERILRDSIHLNDMQWQQLFLADLWLGAQDAVDCGLSTSIGEFSPPRGMRVFNV